MKVLELTEQRAKDLNFILQAAVDRGEGKVFNLTDIDFPDDRFTDSYIDHLLSLLEQYNQPPTRLLVINLPAMKAVHNTKPFLDSGGFLRILRLEQREDRIQDFTLSNLRQSVLGTKEWFKLLVVTIIVAVITTLLTDKLSEKKKQQDTSQAPTQSQSLTTKTYQDSLHSYKQDFKSDTNIK